MMRKPLSAALAGLALYVAGAAVMAQPYDTPPAPSAPREPRIAPPAEGRLPNGLRVVVAERRGLPLVTARLVVLSGAEVDPPQRAGLASVTAGLLTRGTRRHSAPALVAAAEALGGSLESGAGWNASQVGITVTTPKLPAALALVSEVVMQPTFAPAEIERYRTQALDEMKVAYAEPGTLAGLAAQRAVFGNGSYGHPVSGTPASLPRITRAEIAGLHAALYRPDNAVLVLAGDIDLPAALQLAQRHFGGWRAPHTPLPKAGPPVAQPWPEGIVVIDMPGAGQAGVSVALPSIASDAPDRIAGIVTNAVLGTGYSSRLNQEIRIKRGLSYGARSVLDARRGTGLLRASVQTKNPSAAEVVGLIHGELDRLMNTPVPAEELAARKANLIGGFSRSLETTNGLADQVEALQVAGLPASDLVQRIPQLEAVSISDVQAFAMKRFGPAVRRAVVAGVAGEFEAGLKPMAPKITIVPQDKFDLEAQAPQ